MKDTPHIINKQNLFTAKWLRLDLLHYVDRRGHERKWEAAQRVDSNGAVLMIAELRNSGEIILIRQYRPPADKHVIEFPAGLIDDGESPAETAVRELLEETGYHGTVIDVSLPGFNSPGMTGEMIYTVSMAIDDSADRNREPVARQEESEDIETFLVRKDSLESFLRDAAGKGWGIDAKVITYARGCSQ
ncbi:MAG: NUDIX hydrolase [Victivallaceae bacterium]|jgi:8-oxo-dGTP pyrophosphatase MutT (NUDIX family)